MSYTVNRGCNACMRDEEAVQLGSALSGLNFEWVMLFGFERVEYQGCVLRACCLVDLKCVSLAGPTLYLAELQTP